MRQEVTRRMAIVKLSSLIIGIRGSVGGVTFSDGAGGPYAKAWGRGSNGRARKQQRARSFFGSMGAQWQALSGAQRSDWDDLAVADPEPTFNSLGEPVTLSGFGYFARCNTRRLALGMEILQDAPTGTEATQPVEPAVTNFEVRRPPISWFRVEWTDPGYEATDLCLAFVTVIPSGSPVYDPSVIKFVASELATAEILNAWDEFIAIFGLPASGWTISGRFYAQRASGLRSVPTKLLTNS